MKIKKIFHLLCMLGFCVWCLESCNPPESYSKIPEIRYKSLQIVDKMHPDLGIFKNAVLTFSFIDGDGDIGDPNVKNAVSRIHYTWYQKLIDGTYKPHQSVSGAITDSTAIPYDQVMDRSEAQNKFLKGFIEITLEAPTNIPQGVDTMRIEFFIFDRARNKSNVEYTPDFNPNTYGPVK